MTARGRVAITGVGTKSPAGLDPEELADAVLRAGPTAAEVDEFVAADLAVTFASRVPEFDTERYLRRRDLSKMDRAAVLGTCAAADAVRAAGLDGAVACERLGVAVGMAAGGLTAAENVMGTHGDRPREVPAFTVPRIMPSSLAARIGLSLGARGPALTYTTACASGANAIGEAALMIRSGRLDAVVAGGAEATVSPVIMSSFARLGALSRRNDEPAQACRPFDADRDGFVMGEGAAFLVLERWEHALARGTTILGELLGYGTNSDAFHMVAPREDGSVAADCMRAALADAGLAPDEVGHINAHGTSTVHNDRAEANAITRCFGTSGPPVTSSKGVLGHSLGAAGAMEAAVALACADRGLVPPVTNFTKADADTDGLWIVSGRPEEIDRAPAVSNSFGFGGHNATLVLAPC
ncbi:beta-ketoacyl-[acyl-carrier-protein] synthase family protein [Nocardiopsis aegyptia]|uniref:beta-ketoacyl-[acyl-carrier-protein] synthase family protein n=1 Tax=Nocardiopsis aegyptia TaxID=220378 RepID=UPI00366C4C64